MINRLCTCFHILINRSVEKPKAEMETRSNYAPDGQVTMANDCLEWNCNTLVLVFKLYLVRNYFCFFIYFFFFSDVMFEVMVSDFGYEICIKSRGSCFL